VLGGFGAWAGQGSARKAARVNRREAQRWKVEAERLKDEVVAADPVRPALTDKRAA